MALCLSGGGYRAMLFHVGALWRLNELGLLPRLDRVSSVSGGSITAGVARPALGASSSSTTTASRRLRGRGRRADARAGRRRRSTQASILARPAAARHGRRRRSPRPTASTSSAARRCRTCPTTGRASSSTPPTCRRARCGGSPSPTWPTTASAWSRTPERAAGGGRGRLVGVPAVALARDARRSTRTAIAPETGDDLQRPPFTTDPC